MVLIIRHAEKPDETTDAKDPNLAKKGFERADALAKALPERFGRPDFLIATHRSKGSNRPVETITPLARALHEEIDASLADDQFAEVAKELLNEPKYAGKVVLIAWHHGKIPQLARALGVVNAPGQWDSRVFDRVWKITFEAGKAKLTDLPQKALPGDSD
jgi:broad specificity phosphatase PhoE